MLSLTAILHSDPGASPPLEFVNLGDAVTIGRAPECDVVLAGNQYGASGKHAKIERRGGAYYLFDLGSRNGTALNGTKIRADVSVPLSNGDKIYLGRWLLRCTIKSQLAERLARVREAQDPRVVAIGAAVSVAPDPAAALREQIGAVELADQLYLLRQLERATGPMAQIARAERVRQESLREAALQFVNQLAAHHAGDERVESVEQIERFFRLTDQTLELTLEWIVSCLQARKTFGEKFSAKVTRFFGLDSNPLKHALMPQQAGRYLLNWSADRDVEQIKQNLADAFRDLTAHQLGLVAGVQEALKLALKQVDPESTEKDAKSTLGGPFRRAAAWDAFKSRYAELMDNESKLFNEVVYPALRQGYLLAHESLVQSEDDGEDYCGETIKVE